MRYRYEVLGPNGESIKGVVEAASESDAEDTLWQANLLILKLRRAFTLPSLDEAVPSIFGVKRLDVINFSRDLATLLESGIPLLRSLEILGQQSRKRAFKNIIQEIADDLQEGEAFSDACNKHRDVFPIYFIRLVQVGEGTGNLPDILREVSAHMAKDEATSSKVKSSMAYPVFVLLLAFGSVFVMFSFVLPALSGLFNEMGGELPLITRIMIGMGDFMGVYYLHCAAVLGGIAAAGWLYLRFEAGRKMKDRLMLTIPMLKEVALKGNLCRSCRNIYTLLRAGVVLTDALPLAIKTMDNRVVKDALTGCLIQVHSGLSLSRAMAAYPIFPPLMSQMIAVGEETGKLDANLQALATFYEEETDRAISRLIGMLGPILIIIVGGIVGLVAVTLFSSIYSTTSLIE